MRKESLTRRNFVALAALGGVAAQLAPRALAQAAEQGAAAEHPLDPLTASEVAVLKSVLAGETKLGPRTIYVWVQAQEPPKSAVLAFEPGKAFQRTAFIVALSPENRTSYEILVDIRRRAILAFKDLGNLQAFLAEAEFREAERVVDGSAAARAALEKRGYSLPGKISDRFFIDCYAPGEDTGTHANGKTIRAARVLFADRQGGINDFGPYVEGLMVIVDVYAGEILAVRDLPGATAHVTVPDDIFNRSVLGPIEPAADLSIAPATISRLTLRRNHVRWANWDFRYSFNQREGLVLHQIAYDDDGTLRSICYRAAISEMLVPYADPSPGWIWREFYDGGEYGLGAVSVSARAGKELPGNAITLPAGVPSDKLDGLEQLPDRIFFYERDGGTLFAHVQEGGEHRVYGRAKELVAGFVSTIGNYDYMFSFVFRNDGSFAFETSLQGLILNKTVAATRCASCDEQAAGGPGTYRSHGETEFSTLVSPQMAGVTHQHWINLRMDFDIDGTENAVAEYNVVPLSPDPQTNPAGRTIALERTVFGKASEAARTLNEATRRSWVVYNPSKRSPIGHFPGYEIEAVNNTFSSIPESRFGEPSSFVQRHFWTTQYDPTQLYAAGTYPNQYPHGYSDDLFHYAGEESIYKQDVVVWYSLGFTHVTRPEDFPIMPGESVSVNFKPRGFFDRAPSLGLVRIEP